MLYVTGNQKVVRVAFLSAAEWIRKTWNFYTVKSYSGIKKGNPEALVGKWIQPEIMLLGEMVRSYVGEHPVVSLV